MEKGHTILVGTNQGIYAEVKPDLNQLIVHAFLTDGTQKTLTLPMEQQALLTEAKKGRFFSYAAGVAYKIINQYHVCGL